MHIFSSQPRGTTEPLPNNGIKKHNFFWNDLSLDVLPGAAQLQDSSIAVVDHQHCVREHTLIKLRENLLSHVCDEFDISSVAEDKLWMKTDGKQCIARNCKMFWGPSGKPLATFQESSSRMTAAIKVDGPGFSFLVRICWGSCRLTHCVGAAGSCFGYAFLNVDSNSRALCTFLRNKRKGISWAMNRYVSGILCQMPHADSVHM